MPPLFGNSDAICAKAIAALAEALTTSASNPEISSAYCLKAGPNAFSSSAKVVNVLSPIHSAKRPPLLGSSVAMRAMANAALADASTTSASMPFTLSAYSANAGPKSANSDPKSANEEPPVSQDVNPVIKSVAVRIRMASANDFTPFKELASTFLIPSINGVAFTIKSDKSLPICGRPDVTPVMKPLTTFPKNEPSP